jgi:hypothetical protein
MAAIGGGQQVCKIACKIKILLEIFLRIPLSYPYYSGPLWHIQSECRSGATGWLCRSGSSVPPPVRRNTAGRGYHRHHGWRGGVDIATARLAFSAANRHRLSAKTKCPSSAATAVATCWPIAARAVVITAQPLTAITSPTICRCGHCAVEWSAPDADISALTCGRIGDRMSISRRGDRFGRFAGLTAIPEIGNSLSHYEHS